MKKIYLAGMLSLLAVFLGYSQSVPQGMNYQAVARDKAGNPLANQPISLQITLYSNQSKATFYTETHTATTNEFGLFSLIIGEGTVQSGAFANIPWSQEEVWMTVGIQAAGQSEYTPIGSSKLYTVPYAFYAGSIANPTPDSKALAAGNSQCPCNGGITTLSVLYLGPSGATVRVYNNSALQNTGLVQTFTSVANGAILTIHVPANLGTLQSTTYFEYSAIPSPPAVTAVPTVCTSNYTAVNPASPGGTWGPISVISQTDQNGETCTACNVSGLWYVGGNAVLSACNTLGTLSNNDLVLITNNTPRLVVSAAGDVTADNNVNVNKDLNVLGNVKLNQSNGTTTNNGPFTVANFSPTTLTGTLTTNGATLLNNTLTVGQATNLNGLLNVNNQQPTDLTGSLTVNRATKLDSSLWVSGNTDLHGYLHVDEQAPSVFTGTVTGYDNATFEDHVLISNASFNSSSTTTGALVVAGGTGIGENLYVGGQTYLLNSLSVGGNTDLYGYLHVDNSSPTLLTGTLADSGNATFFQHVTLANAGLGSVTPYDGALVVAGGVGIGQNLNVEGASTFHGPVSFGSVVTFTDTVNSTNYNNGTIVDYGGAGIAENLNVGGATDIKGITHLENNLLVYGTSTLYNAVLATANVTINSQVNGLTSNPNAYPLTVEGSNQGIRIQVNGAHNGIAGFDNDYIQFVDNTGTARGAITGETQTDLNSDPTYIAHQAELSFMVAMGVYGIYTARQNAQQIALSESQAATAVDEAENELILASSSVTQDLTNEIAADASVTGCEGLGFCVTDPIPSEIAAGIADDIEAGVAEASVASATALAAADESLAAADAVLAGTNVTTAAVNEAKAIANLATFNAETALEIPGIYFKSGSGDYAEWLPKANPTEEIYRGDVVGVKGGFISKSTEGAEKLMVISTVPIVLGNEPPAGKAANYEKVAFIGQVKVKVFGAVAAGDYIVAEGASGFGVGKHAADMNTEDYSKIVGIAWEGTSAKGMSYVNTAVGLNTNDMAKWAMKQDARLKAQDDEISALKKQMDEVNNALSKLVPGYNASAASTSSASVQNTVAVNNKGVQTTVDHSKGGTKQYLEFTRAEFEEGYKTAIANCLKSGIKPEKNPALKRLMEDPAYKEQLYSQMKERQRKEIEKRKAVDNQFGY